MVRARKWMQSRRNALQVANKKRLKNLLESGGKSADAADAGNFWFNTIAAMHPFFAPVFFYYISALAQETIALNLVGEKVLGVDDAEVVHLFRDHSYSATDHKSEKNVI